MAGYKSVGSDSEPTADSSAVTLGGNGMKVINQACGPENNTNFQQAPSGTKHGRTSGQHMSAAQTRSDLYSHTSAISQKAHMGVDQYLTPSNPSSASSVPRLAPLVMHNFTFPLQFSLKTYSEHGAIFKFAVMNILTRIEKMKSDNSRLCCAVTSFNCMGDEI